MEKDICFDEINLQLMEAMKNLDTAKVTTILSPLVMLTEGNPKNCQHIIDAGIVSNLEKLLYMSNNIELTKLVLNILKFISRGNESHKQVIIDEGGIPALMTLLATTDNFLLLLLAAEIFAHIALGNDNQRKVVIEESDVIFAFIDIFNRSKSPIIAEALHSISNMVESIDSFFVPFLVTMLDFENENASLFALKMLEIIACENTLKKQAIIKNGGISALIKVLKNGNNKMHEAAFEVLSVLALGSRKQKQSLIKAGVVPLCINFLDLSNSYISILAAETLENIALGNKKQKQIIIHAGAIPRLVPLICSKNLELCKSAMETILRISNGTIATKHMEIESNIYLRLLKLICSPHSKISINAISLLAKLCEGNEKESQMLLEAGIIPSFLNVLELILEPLKPDDLKKCDAATILFSNIMSNSQGQCKIVLMSEVLSLIEKAKGQKKYKNVQNMPPCHNVPSNAENGKSGIICTEEIFTSLDSNDFKNEQRVSGSAAAATEKLYSAGKGVLSQHIELLHSSNVNLQRIALQALSNFAKGTAEQKHILANSGIIPDIIDFLASDDPGVRYNTLLILFLVSNVTTKNLSETMITHLLNLLKSSNANEWCITSKLFVNIAKGSILENVISTKSFTILLDFLDYCDAIYTPMPVIKLLLFEILFGETKFTYLQSLVLKEDGNRLLKLLLSSDPDLCKYGVTLFYLFLTTRNAKKKKAAFQAEAVPCLLKLLNSTNLQYQILSILLFFSEEHLQELMDNGICPYVIEYCHSTEEQTSHIALSLLTNIVWGSKEQIRIAVEAGATDIIINFLKNVKLSPKTQHFCTKVMISLHTILLELPDQHEDIVKLGGIPVVARLLNPKYKLLCETAMSFFERISHSNIDEVQNVVQKFALIPLTKLFNIKDISTQIIAINTVAKISTRTSEQRKVFLENNIMKQFVKLLLSKNADIILLTVKLFAIFANGSVEEKEAVIKANALLSFSNLLYHEIITICYIVADILHDISFNCSYGIQGIIDVNLIPHLMNMLSSSDINLVLTAAKTIKNIIDGSDEERQIIIQVDTELTLTELLHSADEYVILCTLKAIKVICCSNPTLLAKFVPIISEFKHSENANIRENVIWILINSSCGTVEC
uniref:Armadillo repeat-containing protein 8 n=1 Tax=Panagrolaimus davidi TaxID=227884 RepID=A0A914P2C0_9BILA